MTRVIPLISVVVLGFRNFERTTKPCLQSLQRWFEDDELEFIVVDNGSPDDAAARTQEWCAQHPNIQCFCISQNLGFAGGMNFGVMHAKGKWLFLVNNDTLFPEHALEALKGVVRSVPDRVAMLGPVTNAAGNGQRLYKPDASVDQWMSQGAWLNTHPTQKLIHTYRCDFFCIAIRHDVWKALNGLDTSFGLGYYEDFDFSLRLRAAGWVQCITEDVFVLHMGSASFQASKEAKILIRNNKHLLKRKHPNALFEHTRLGNFKVLLQYVEMKQSGHWTQPLIERAKYRLSAWEQDRPKSLIKRCWWILKTKKWISIIRS